LTCERIVVSPFRFLKNIFYIIFFTRKNTWKSTSNMGLPLSGKDFAICFFILARFIAKKSVYNFIVGRSPIFGRVVRYPRFAAVVRRVSFFVLAEFFIFTTGHLQQKSSTCIFWIAIYEKEGLQG
jgi:hypothetical protein